MTRRWATLAVLLLLASSGAACGKYGRPIRTKPTPPTTSAQPSAAQPNAAGAASPSTPAGEACEDDPEKPTP